MYTVRWMAVVITLGVAVPLLQPKLISRFLSMKTDSCNDANFVITDSTAFPISCQWKLTVVMMPTLLSLTEPHFLYPVNENQQLLWCQLCFYWLHHISYFLSMKIDSCNDANFVTTDISYFLSMKIDSCNDANFVITDCTTFPISCNWKLTVVMMPTLLSLAETQVVVMITSGVTFEHEVGIVTTFVCQLLYVVWLWIICGVFLYTM